MISEEILKADNGISKWSIVLAKRGSQADGTATSVSDIDLISVCVPPKKFYLGLSKYGSDGSKEIKQFTDYDIVVYELHKFMRLLSGANPNVMPVLFLEDFMYIINSEAMRALVDHRDLFISKQCLAPFVGMGKGQLTRMTVWDSTRKLGEKRKKLVETYGYDTHNGASLIKTVRQGIELLKTGRMFLDRRNIDAQDIIDIKQGKWSIEKIKAEAEELFKEATDAHSKSTLPETVDFDKINALTVKLVEVAWKGRDEK